MMIIRNDHLRAFEAAMIAPFKQRLLTHFRLCFGEITETYTDEELLELIDNAIGKAATYGLDTEQTVCAFADLILLFGTDFDKECDFISIQSILNESSLLSSEELVGRLYDAAKAYIMQI